MKIFFAVIVTLLAVNPLDLKFKRSYATVQAYGVPSPVYTVPYGNSPVAGPPAYIPSYNRPPANAYVNGPTSYNPGYYTGPQNIYVQPAYSAPVNNYGYSVNTYPAAATYQPGPSYTQAPAAASYNPPAAASSYVPKTNTSTYGADPAAQISTVYDSFSVKEEKNITYNGNVYQGKYSNSPIYEHVNYGNIGYLPQMDKKMMYGAQGNFGYGYNKTNESYQYTSTTTEATTT